MNRQQKLRQYGGEIEKAFNLPKGTVIKTTRQRKAQPKEEPKPLSDLDLSYWKHQIK